MATTCCHLARTICRRAERRVVGLARTEETNRQGQIYLNRLSDLLFVFCRLMARHASQPETMWEPKRNVPDE